MEEIVGQLDAEKMKLGFSTVCFPEGPVYVLYGDASKEFERLRQQNKELLEALHTISSVDANIVNPNYMWDNHTEKGCYETGLLDGAMAVRDAVKTEAYSVIAKATGGE